MSLFQVNLTLNDTFLQVTADPSIPARERVAFKLATQVTPEPFSEFNLDWLLKEATGQAKYVRLEPAAELAVFTFEDRSILVVLQTGMLYAVPTGSSENVRKVIEWLKEQGITERDFTKH